MDLDCQEPSIVPDAQSRYLNCILQSRPVATRDSPHGPMVSPLTSYVRDVLRLSRSSSGSDKIYTVPPSRGYPTWSTGLRIFELSPISRARVLFIYVIVLTC